MDLREFFEKHNKVALGFSGGVDSAYLLWAAHDAGADVRPYYVKTAFQPEFEYEDALKVCEFVGVEPTVIELDILEDEKVAANPSDRCYYCKSRIFGAITERAVSDGYEVLIDGTNASDSEDDRPGFRALKELKVLSPLRLAGLTKDEIRKKSKEAGLFTWDKPAYACLATRFQAGERITLEGLKRTEQAEDFLRKLGLTDFRVRSIDDNAKIEVTEKELGIVFENREKIYEKLSEMYKGVLLDLRVR